MHRITKLALALYREIKRTELVYTCDKRKAAQNARCMMHNRQYLPEFRFMWHSQTGYGFH